MTAGAPELRAIEVGGITRGAFILRGALAAGAVYGVGAVGPYVSRAFAQVAARDVEVLSFALTLERLEAAFYEAALKKGGLSAEVEQVAKEFGAHERQHVDVLESGVEQLGEKPPGAPKASFSIGEEQAFLDLAVTLEETGVSAYNGAIPAITSADLVDVAGSIAQVEGRHAGALRFLAGQDPAPAAFDKALSEAQVTKRVRQYVAGRG